MLVKVCRMKFVKLKYSYRFDRIVFGLKDLGSLENDLVTG